MSMKLIEHVAHKDLYREQLNSFFEKCDMKLINDKTFYDLFAMPGLINMSKYIIICICKTPKIVFSV